MINSIISKLIDIGKPNDKLQENLMEITPI